MISCVHCERLMDEVLLNVIELQNSIERHGSPRANVNFSEKGDSLSGPTLSLRASTRTFICSDLWLFPLLSFQVSAAAIVC